MKKISQPVRLIIFSLGIVSLLGACAVSTPTAVPSPTETQQAAAPFELDLEADGSPFIVYQGGYRFEAPLGSDVSIIGPSTTLSAEGDALLFKLDGLNKMSINRNAQEILDILINTLFSADQSRVNKSDPITSAVEGYEGVAYDFTGTFLNHKVEGRALVVKPSEKRYISIIGMALVDDQPDLWQTTGKDFSITCSAITLSCRKSRSPQRRFVRSRLMRLMGMRSRMLSKLAAGSPAAFYARKHTWIICLVQMEAWSPTSG